MLVRTVGRKRTSRNLRSTIASFAIEGIIPSRQAIKYCKLRDAGKVSCETEIEALKKKYKEMAQR